MVKLSYCATIIWLNTAIGHTKKAYLHSLDFFSPKPANRQILYISTALPKKKNSGKSLYHVIFSKEFVPISPGTRPNKRNGNVQIAYSQNVLGK